MTHRRIATQRKAATPQHKRKQAAQRPSSNCRKSIPAEIPSGHPGQLHFPLDQNLFVGADGGQAAQLFFCQLPKTTVEAADCDAAACDLPCCVVPFRLNTQAKQTLQSVLGGRATSEKAVRNSTIRGERAWALRQSYLLDETVTPRRLLLSAIVLLREASTTAVHRLATFAAFLVLALLPLLA